MNIFVKFILELYANWVSFEIESWMKKGGSLHWSQIEVYKRRRENTHKNTKKREELKRPTTIQLFIFLRQGTKRLFHFCSSSFVRRFVIFILFSNDFGILVATSLWWHRQVKQKNEMDFLSRHSLINIRELGTKDCLWITEKKIGSWNLFNSKKNINNR